MRMLKFFFVLLGSVLIYGSLWAQNFNIILGRPTESSVTISILFDQSMDVFWEYGTSAGTYSLSSNTQVAAQSTPLEVDLSNLLPDTKYFYRTRYRPAGGSSTFLAGSEHTFHTQRATSSTFTFTVEADEHLYDYGNPNLYRITLSNEAADNPDFMISLGDIFGDDHYPWTITSHDCDSLHLLYRERLGTICHSIPFYICLGNHEGEKEYYLDSIPAANLALWSTLWRKNYYPNPFPNNFYSGDTLHENYSIGEAENYYAWTWGSALFIVLDAYRYDCYNGNCTAKPNNWDWTLGLPQYTWLKNTLESSNAKFKFVFAHHVSGESRGGIVPAKLFEWGGYNKSNVWEFDTQRPGWAKPIHQLFVDNNVTIFFQGHDHLFAHEVMDGITYQEVPMAADSTYTKGMLANGDAYTSDTIDASGHVKVTISPTCVKVNYVRSFLPRDTLGGAHHNRETAFIYSIGNCPAGINNQTEIPDIRVYPVPTTDKINVLVPDQAEHFQFYLMNTLGQIVRQTQSTSIDVRGIQDGIYYLLIRCPEYEVNKKVIICR